MGAFVANRLKYFMPTLENDPSVEDIQRNILRNDPNREYVYVILGRPGPTGKSTLQRELNLLGYDAYEITEQLLRVGGFEGEKNAFLVNEFEKYAVIVLNRRVR